MAELSGVPQYLARYLPRNIVSCPPASSHLGHLQLSGLWCRVETSAANRLIGENVQSRRRPLLGPSPGRKRLLALSHLRKYA